MGADLCADEDRAAVQPDPGAAGRAIGGDPPRVRAEPVARVLGGDPALQGGSSQVDLILGEAELGSVAPEAIRSWVETRSTSVTSSVTVCSTWIRGFISMKT